jgi:hypothetical protein
MRKELSKIKEIRKRFTGTFVRFGEKKDWNGYNQRTLLLQKVAGVDSPEILTDHLWFTYSKAFEDLGFLKEGDTIEFDARVKEYVKGYVNRLGKIDQRRNDFKLSHPTKVKRVLHNS